MKYNLILADDHKMFLEGLLSILASEINYNIIFTAKNGKQITKYLDINPKEKVDLIISDISMPEIDGVTLNKIVKEKRKDIKVLIVSMHISPEFVDQLINNDVDGYLPKNADKREFLEAINSILEGKKYFSREIQDNYVKSKFSKPSKDAIKLSSREIEVISLIAQEYTTQEIADKLFLSKHTIESYRKNLITKLKVRNLAGLTKYAIQKKYVQF